jgi:hypothetical protein
MQINVSFHTSFSQVATVVLPQPVIPFLRNLGKPLALEMLRYGWATTYEQAGAEYGKWGKDEFIRIESVAKCVLPSEAY